MTHSHPSATAGMAILPALEAEEPNLESLPPVVKADLELLLVVLELIPSIPGLDLLDLQPLRAEDLENLEEHMQLQDNNLLTHPLQIGTD